MRAIVAMDSNRVIGNGTKIPWYIPDDFQWFKRATMGSPLLMGRTTFEAIGKPLPGRFTHVLTRDTKKVLLPSTNLYTYVGESWVDNISRTNQDQLWICGGATVYERFLPRCTEVYVTHVIGEHDGNVFMPAFEHDFPNQTVILEHKDFLVVKHSR